MSESRQQLQESERDLERRLIVARALALEHGCPLAYHDEEDQLHWDRKAQAVLRELDAMMAEARRTGSIGPSRFWYWPFWQVTRPWLPRAWRGSDEYDQATISVYIPLLGAFHYGTGRIVSWRCEDCQCLNSPQHWCCYLCGAGNPEDA